MKAYFIQLFQYDLAVNLKIIRGIDEHKNQQAVRLMAHLLVAQQIWLKRCKGEKTIGGALWPDWPLDLLENIAKENNSAWLAYLEDLKDTDFDKTVFYKNSKGDSFENKLQDVVTHLINHGTHHRAQAGQQLKFAALNPLPNTDYIFYIREKK